MTTQETIEQILRQSLNIRSLKIIDDSDLHKGHHGNKDHNSGHFTLLIQSPDFQGKSLKECHQQIYKLLENEMKTTIHALAIKIIQ